MEQKRTLWIISAAGIFLLVVFGAALILYSKPMQPSSTQIANSSAYNPSIGWTNPEPQKQLPIAENNIAFNTEEPSAPANKENSETDNSLKLSPFVKAENAQEQNSQIHTDKVTVISDNATVYSNTTTTIDLNSLKSSSNSGIVAKNEMTANQINTNRAQEERLPPPPVREAQPSAPQENYYTPAPVAKAPAPSAKPAAASAKKATSTPAKSSSVAKAPVQTKAAAAAKVASTAKKAPDSFWVQAAAYTSKRNADEARSTLESNKISSEVFTYTDSKGKTFYRVRVGPYVTKSEAEYWQTRISMIDKFASSKSVIVNTAIN